MMNKKSLPQIITAVLLAIFIVLGFGACASTPLGPFSISPSPLTAGTLQNKKAVIFNIEMVERSGASRQEGGRSGGLLGILQVGAGIASVLSYNNSAKNFDETNAADLKEALTVFDALIATTWQQAYNAETVQAAYNFGRSNRRLDFFNRPNAALIREMADILAHNNAEYAVTIMQQITHGYLAEGMIGTGNTAITHISAQINVFDRNGVVISALAKLPNTGAGMSNGYILTANNAEDYSQLYLDGLKNILATILAFDPSASSFTIEDLIEGISIKLDTTEDIE